MPEKYLSLSSPFCVLEFFSKIIKKKIYYAKRLHTSAFTLHLENDLVA
jgi:hypothetical protein